MKRVFCSFLSALMLFAVQQADAVKYVDAQSLTFLGKMCETTNPYHRVEVDDYPSLNNTEKTLLRDASGLAVVFETNSSSVWVKAQVGVHRTSTGMPRAAAEGFNMYIDVDGEWVWASSKANATGKNADGTEKMDAPLQLIGNMDKSMKRCIVYLPLFTELKHLEIGVDDSADIRAVDNPFRHKVVIFGSSFTHGSCASAAGMTYPAFLSRQTGLYMCSLGMSGNSKLQKTMAEIMAKSDADAFICDAFSNPTTEIIGERIRPFIETIQAKHPNKPIIFLETIYRESRNFDQNSKKFESERVDYVRNLMKTIVKEYDDVYYVDVTNQTGTDHLTSADGIHPYSWGYKRWADAIQKPITKILKKYGIK